MFRYEAPNPYNNEGSFFSFLTSSSVSSSHKIGKLVVPAQSREPKTIGEMTLNQFAHTNGLVIQGGYVGTHDSAVLDTIELKPKTESNSSLGNQHFIIKFNGNGMFYQDVLHDFAYDANKLNVTIIGFNYRGVGNSKKTPETFQDLVTDGIAQVQRLLDSGIDSKKITLDGLSLGGGVATMVASHFHKIGKPVYLWNDRSFASISKAAAGVIAPEIDNIFGETLSTSFEYTSWSLMKPAGWDVNVAKAYNEIADEYKNHMYVAKKSALSCGDGVIAHRASLHEGVKQDEKKRGISTAHKVYAQNGFFGGGHNMSRSDLVSAENTSLTGQDQFDNFIRNHTNYSF
ncbi:alpha/beta hydrolase [Legionella longbeachae]|uniref:SidB homolog, putative substrate of the Dot/Icm system n=1 Tax=Legionella longbeachae serogroup 1 (strain NSW150) TaxID=661367 RepID=D3HRH3_LEGLN|nr:alpha/beta hydrolase [Legionella longbeachae]VEE02005.1 sidB homolog, substrate of the Dot/Icm system [Legionella oakridgensis]ARB91688.1 alpha/beta hydrolase [Legionella longbeachae]EEZ95383.1 putative SidB protein [Legionella longbeachae D-4968]QIN31895.1 alpha/beta hydrolase [Legionella longbeachae]QIN35239.1 alpha/beta hydrolase [Legionella longbeachae]